MLATEQYGYYFTTSLSTENKKKGNLIYNLQDRKMTFHSVPDVKQTDITAHAKTSEGSRIILVKPDKSCCSLLYEFHTQPIVCYRIFGSCCQISPQALSCANKRHCA